MLRKAAFERRFIAESLRACWDILCLAKLSLVRFQRVADFVQRLDPTGVDGIASIITAQKGCCVCCTEVFGVSPTLNQFIRPFAEMKSTPRGAEKSKSSVNCWCSAGSSVPVSAHGSVRTADVPEVFSDLKYPSGHVY